VSTVYSDRLLDFFSVVKKCNNIEPNFVVYVGGVSICLITLYRVHCDKCVLSDLVLVRSIDVLFPINYSLY